MINWIPTTAPPEPGETVWAMDEDYGISPAVFNGINKYIHETGFDLIGIKWWTKYESINLPLNNREAI